jgi:chromosome segregation ATPase
MATPGGRPVSEKRDDLKATNESLRQDAETIREIEEHKATLRPSDPRVDQLSERVENLVERMSVKAAAQTQLAAEIDRDPTEPDGPLE